MYYFSDCEDGDNDEEVHESTAELVQTQATCTSPTEFQNDSENDDFDSNMRNGPRKRNVKKSKFHITH